MAARTKSKVTRKYKTQYRVMNWPAYEAALRKRGDVTLWFDEDALAAGECCISEWTAMGSSWRRRSPTAAWMMRPLASR